MYNYYAGPGYYQNIPGSNSLKGRPVSSLDEVRAAQIDFDGSLFIFPDVANKKIYTKQIGLDGTASLKIYNQLETPVSTAPAYITKEELENILSNYQIKEQKKDEPKSITTGSNSCAINF